jgi:hypothetical protein
MLELRANYDFEIRSKTHRILHLRRAMPVTCRLIFSTVITPTVLYDFVTHCEWLHEIFHTLMQSTTGVSSI